MECKRVQDSLSDFLDASLPEDERAAVAAHLSRCRPCMAAAEGLKETLARLRRLPAVKAPPELLEKVRARTGAAASARQPLWRTLFLPARVKIPLEAAVAVLLFLLVFGWPREEPPKAPLSVPAGNTQGPQDANRLAAMARKAAEPAPRGAGRDRPAGPTARSTRKGAGKVPEPPPRASTPPPSLPAVPAQRASTAGETIGPSFRPERVAEESASPRVFAAPPSRLLRPLPYGRIVTLEVTPEDRAGLEQRIAEAAARIGGSVRPHAERSGYDAMRVHVPAAAAEAFLDELRKIGAIPPEGVPGATDLPAGPSADVVAFTVQLRVR